MSKNKYANELPNIRDGDELQDDGSILVQGPFRFVPDESGGHILGKTGVKWYPENVDHAALLAAKDEEIGRLRNALQMCADANTNSQRREAVEAAEQALKESPNA